MAYKKGKFVTGPSIPEEVPVFPLPNGLLFPETEVPLYIFEPRYRQMLADCFRTHKFMALSLFKPGWQSNVEPIPSHEMVGVGYLRVVIDNDDGTSHVLLHGVTRAKILRYTQMTPYRIARLERIPDVIEDPKELMRLCRQLKKLLVQKIRWDSENPGLDPHFEHEMDNPIALSHMASFLIRGNPYLKQDLLETVNSNCRIRHLIDLLEEEIYPHGSQN